MLNINNSLMPTCKLNEINNWYSIMCLQPLITIITIIAIDNAVKLVNYKSQKLVVAIATKNTTLS